MYLKFVLIVVDFIPSRFSFQQNGELLTYIVNK